MANTQRETGAAGRGGKRTMLMICSLLGHVNAHVPKTVAVAGNLSRSSAWERAVVFLILNAVNNMRSKRRPKGEVVLITSY